MKFLNSIEDASKLVEDSTHRLVTDAEKAVWNAKAPAALATTSSSGLMSGPDKTKLDGIAAGANKVLNHANNGSISVDGVEQAVYTHPTTTGNKHIPAGGSAGQVLKYSSDGTAVWGTDNNTTYSNATTSVSGLMSAGDKSKLDGVATGANNYSLPVATSGAIGGVRSGADITVDASGNVSVNDDSHTHDARYYTETEIQTGVIYMRSPFMNPNGVPSSNLGSPNLAEMALFEEQFSNKIEFYNTSSVSFQTSVDRITWTNFSVSDSVIANFVGGDYGTTIDIPYGTAYFRIKVRAQNYVYLNALYMYWSSNGHSTKVKLYKKHDLGDYTQHTSSEQLVNAWPGHLYLPFFTIPFNVNATLNSHWHEFYVEFEPTWNPSFPANRISLYKFQVWGGYPGGKRRLYSVDSAKNATFPANVVASKFVGESTSSNKLATARNISLTGDVTGSASFDGSSDASIVATIADDSHNHIIGNIDGLQTALDGKSGTGHTHTRSNITDLGTVAGINTNASTTNYLRGDGTWATPPDTNTTYSVGNGIGLTGTVFSVAGGNGLSQETNGLALGTPSTITNATTNSVTSTSHTHALTLTKADITALGIPAQDTVYIHPTTSGNKHIPSGGSAGQFLKWSADGTATWAADNDTVYTHPATHPPSVIAQDASNRFVSDAEKATWNAKGTSNLALGTTSTTAYRGDYGNTAYTHSQSPHAPSGAQVNQTLTSGNGMAAWTATNGNLTINLGTPSTLTSGTTNTTTATSHTHAVTFPVTSVSSGNGMASWTNTGAITATLGTPSTLTNSTTNAVTATSHTHEVALTELVTGISSVKSTGISVNKGSGGIYTEIADNGLTVYDGSTTLASFGDLQAYIPYATIDKIDSSDVVSTVFNPDAEGGDYTFQVGPGQEYATVSQVIEYLFPFGRTTIIGDADIDIYITGSIYDEVVLKGIEGNGRIYIRFNAGARLSGYIWARDCKVRVYIRSVSSTLNQRGVIKAAGAPAYAVWNESSSHIHLINMDIDASGKTAAVQGNDSGQTILDGCDIVNTTYAIYSRYSHTIRILNCKGNASYGAYADNLGLIMVAGTTCIKGSTSNYSAAATGFLQNNGSLTATNSAFSPPAQSDQTFTQVFTPTSMYTEVGRVKSTFYGKTAAQNRWSTDYGYATGFIAFGSDAGAFFTDRKAGTTPTVEIRLRRLNTSHGTASTVAPTPKNFSPYGGTRFVGATRGAWTATTGTWTKVDPSLITAAGFTFQFNNDTTGNTYSIWDAAELRITKVKRV